MASRSSSQNSRTHLSEGSRTRPGSRGAGTRSNASSAGGSKTGSKSGGTYYGYSSKYPNPSDEARAQKRADAPPPKFDEKPLHPQHTNYRGHSKCKFCAKFVPEGMLDEHYEECPLVTMRCELRDTETDEPCFYETRGRNLMSQHQSVCPMRTEVCDNRGCGEEVSVRSKKFHLSHCNYQKMLCPTCGLEFQRNELLSHEGACPEASVQCPLGCGESMRQGDLVFHLQNTATQHVECVQKGAMKSGVVTPSDPQSVYSVLVSKIAELEQRLDIYANTPRRSRANSVVETPLQNGSPPRNGGGDTQPRNGTPAASSRASPKQDGQPRASGTGAAAREDHQAEDDAAANDKDAAGVAEEGQDNSETEAPAEQTEEFHAGQAPPLDLEQTNKPKYSAPVDQLSQLPHGDRSAFIQEELADFQTQLADLHSGLSTKTLTKSAGRAHRQNLLDMSAGLKDLLDEYQRLAQEEAGGDDGTFQLLRRKMSRLDRTWCSLQIDLYEYLFHS